MARPLVATMVFGAALLLAGCPDPVLSDAGEPDATVDASFPRDAEPTPDSSVAADAAAEDTGPSAPRKVQAGGFAPSLGQSSSEQHKVTGRIPPPTSLGNAESTQYKVRGSAGAPR